MNAVGILIGYNGIQVYILYAPEDILFNLWINFFKFGNKIFNFRSL